MKKLIKIFKVTGIIVGILLVLMTIAMYIFGVFDLLFTGINPEEGMTRTEAEDYLELLLKKSDDDLDELTEIAYYQYFLGDFDDAEYTLEKVLNADNPPFNAFSLMAELYYLRGDYLEAEKMMIKEKEKAPLNLNVQLKTQARLTKIYYQINAYSKVEDYKLLSLIGMGGFIEWMSSFEEEPYQIEWPENGMTVVPIESIDPLPIVKMEIQGISYYFMIDTGGDALIVDNRNVTFLEKASGSMKGSFGGGMESELTFMSIESIKLNDLVIHNVPAMAMDMSHFDNILSEEELTTLGLPLDFKLTGILGTKIFQQVLGTLDYPNKALFLRNPSMYNSRESVHNIVEAFEFSLSELHILTAKGKLMNQEVMFWIDSGYASDTCGVLLPIETYNDMGIMPPELVYEEDAISGGGKGYENGELMEFGAAGFGQEIVEEIGLGYDPGLNFYWDNDYILDGMISHRYLKNYAWTMDFNNHIMYLSR